jgi:hypothetical protein
VRATASLTLRNTSADTWFGVFSARDAVIGATPASLATSCSVTAPLPRRVRLAGGMSPAMCAF